MSILDEFDRRVLDSFPGADLRSDRKKLLGAVESRNVEFDLGDVHTRRGFAEILDPALADTHIIRALFDWFEAQWHRLVYYVPHSSGGAFYSRNFNLNITDTIVSGLSSSGAGASIASFGARLFMTTFTNAASGMVGADEGRIWNGLITNGVLVVDKLFQDPIPFSDFNAVPPQYNEPLPGIVSKGEHRFGIVWVTRNGYETRPTTDLQMKFTASGKKNGQLILDPDSTWPAWVTRAKLIVAPVENPDAYFFVPDTEAAVVGGGTTPITFNFDLDDVSLVLAESADEWFNLSDTVRNPKRVFNYGTRMVYLADIPDSQVLQNVTAVFVSDPGEPQWITLNRHQIYLPGRKRVTSHFGLLGGLYLLGPSWTYYLRDNGDYPNTWADATEVSGHVGTPAPHGAASNTAKGAAWVASLEGAHLFRGAAYMPLPFSYYQKSDWDRINWAAAHHVYTVDDAPQQTFKVLVPMDGADSPTHILSWSYENGFDPKDLSKGYSIDDISAASLTPSVIAQVTNPSTKIVELWMAAHTEAGESKVYRQKSAQAGDTLLYNDMGFGIDSRYITPTLPRKNGRSSPRPLVHHGGRIRIHGLGNVVVRAHNMNSQRVHDLPPIPLIADPESEHFRAADIQSEAAHLEFRNASIPDDWFRLSAIEWFYQDWVSQR